MEADDKGKGVPVHTINTYGGVEVASLTNKDFCLLHIQSNTTVFHLVVQ
jgi:hypothetical protein